MVELIVVLIIAAILLGAAIPGFGSLVRTQKLTTAVNNFRASISLTRSEAIKRGRPVDMVPSGADGDWSKGWVVFVDTNQNQRPDTGEQVIFAENAVPDGIVIEAKLGNTAGHYLEYSATGRTRTSMSNDTPLYGSFRFELDGHRRKIIINMLGRARACDPDKDVNTC